MRTTFFRLVVALLGSGLVLAAVGCRQSHLLSTQQISNEGEALYRTYLHGDAEQAEASLEQLIKLVEMPGVNPDLQAEWLLFAYSRVYVVQKKAGNSQLAELAFVKTRYWYLRTHELGHQSTKECAEALVGFTPSKCTELVEKWDRNHNNGREPTYAAGEDRDRVKP